MAKTHPWLHVLEVVAVDWMAAGQLSYEIQSGPVWYGFYVATEPTAIPDTNTLWIEVRNPDGDTEAVQNHPHVLSAFLHFHCNVSDALQLIHRIHQVA